MRSLIGMSRWTLLTNHANVLLAITQEPDIRLRELAVNVGISERAVKRIVADLEESGYLQRERQGRRNHYKVNPAATIESPVGHGLQVGTLLAAMLPVIASTL